MRQTILIVMLALPTTAVAQWTVSPEIRLAAAQGTMGEYLGRGTGVGVSLRNGGPVRLRIQASWTHFGSRGVARPYNGTGPDIGIRSSANIVLVTAGPEVAARIGPVRLGASAGAGGATVLATGSTTFLGDPQQVNRSTTFSSATWAATVSASAATTVGRRVQFVVEGSYVQVGRSKFLREFNLPIGQISGIYLNPSPYSPAFTALSVGARIGI